MARKTNYAFERQERERIQAAKLAEKARLKQEQRDLERAEGEAGGDGADRPGEDG